VQAKVAQAQRRLPKDVQQPTVSKSNPDDRPILTIGVRGPFSRQILADVARYQVQQKLQTLPGVGQVTTSGYLDRNIRLWVDASKLLERGVTASDVTTALDRQHVVVPGGQLQTPGREVTVQVLGEAADLDALREIVVAGKSGDLVHLKDVALVEDGFEDARTIARIDGVPLQALSVLKQRGGQTRGQVGAAQGAEGERAGARLGAPQGARLRWRAGVDPGSLASEHRRLEGLPDPGLGARPRLGHAHRPGVEGAR
jgi:multidrug efflux pump subunit AcrB